MQAWRLEFGSPLHPSKSQATHSVTSVTQGEADGPGWQRIPGVCWPVSLAEMVIYGFSERPSAPQMRKGIKETLLISGLQMCIHRRDIIHAHTSRKQTGASLCMGTQTCTCTHTYTHSQGEKGLFSFPDSVAHFDRHWWHRWFGSLAWSLKRDSASNTTILEGFLTRRLFAAWARMVTEGLGTNIRHETLWQQWRRHSFPVLFPSSSPICPLFLYLPSFFSHLSLPLFLPRSTPSLLLLWLWVLNFIVHSTLHARGKVKSMTQIHSGGFFSLRLV